MQEVRISNPLVVTGVWALEKIISKANWTSKNNLKGEVFLFQKIKIEIMFDIAMILEKDKLWHYGPALQTFSCHQMVDRTFSDFQ